MGNRLSGHVIAVNTQPRNPGLTSEVKQLSILTELEIVDAVTPKDIDEVKIGRGIKKAQVLIGRDVTAVEICISYSHQKAYKSALRLNSDAALILEDDVAIGDIDAFKTLLDQIPPTIKPTIWTFYSPDWSVWTKKKEKFKAVFPPAYASCYIINRNAMNIAINSDPIGLADWPIWSKKVEFYLVSNSCVSIINTKSFVEKGRITAKLRKHKLRSFFSLEFLLTVPLIDRIRHIFLYPMLWKIFLLLRKFQYHSRKANKPQI